ncbi:MAG: adenylosuccinate synthase [Chloroflexota bacterium]
MPVIAVVGGQWGDEGKGKVIDLLAERADVVVRAQGGDNAGHTIVNARGKFALHLVPAGIFNERTECVIGPGVALNPGVLVREMDELNARGVATDRMSISTRAHLVMPYHPRFDALEEQRRGAAAIGTTGRGIGPTYHDKIGRIGLTVGDLLYPARFRERVSALVARKNLELERIYSAPPVDAASIADEYLTLAARLLPHIKETGPLIHAAISDGRMVLIEGAHATLLDIDHGTYPYVTTAPCTVSGLLNGAGIGPRYLTTALGVFKAYTSRVGGGPFPTELLDATGDSIRTTGHEYGTTTGRPRRCGWFDAVAARHSVQVNGFHSIALTRLDILDHLDELAVCVGYERAGKRVEHFPTDLDELADCTPVYEGLPGWKRPTSDARSFDDLPTAARQYVRIIENALGAPTSLIGIGAERERTLVVGDLA